MTSPDKWCDKLWTINVVGKLGDILEPDSGSARFTLDPLLDGVHVIGYRVQFVGGQMNSAWDPPCRLYCFGKTAPPIPTLPHGIHLPLKQWDRPNSDIDKQHGAVATALANSCCADPSLERLMGEVQIEGRLELVSLYQFDEVIENQRAFLLVNALDKSREIGSRNMLESGIAYGNN